MYSFKEYIPFYKRNLRVAGPIILTQLGASLVGFFDTMMVGHYSTTALAAASLANAIFFMVMVFAMGAIMGLTPLVGYEVGRSKIDGVEATRPQISSYLLNATFFTVVLTAVMVVLMCAVIPFFGRMGQDPVVIEEMRTYYILLVISIIPFLLFCLCKQFLEGLGNTFVAMVITLLMNGLNVLLNWVFIFGHWGYEPMGVTGAGIATLVSRILMPIGFISVILWRKDWREYVLAFKLRMCRVREIMKLAHVGIPIGLQTFAETFLFAAAFIIVGWLNKESVAAHQIANQIADLTFMLAMGIGAATTIRVSHQLGSGDIYAVRMASNASIHLCLCVNTLGMIMMVSCRKLLPYLFTSDPDVIAIASQLILMGGIFQYADGMQAVGGAMLRGITDVKVPMLCAFIAYIFIGLPIGIVCTFTLHLGAVGMWIGFIFGLALAAVFFHIRFRKKLKSLFSKK